MNAILIQNDRFAILEPPRSVPPDWIRLRQDFTENVILMPPEDVEALTDLLAAWKQERPLALDARRVPAYNVNESSHP